MYPQSNVNETLASQSDVINKPYKASLRINRYRSMTLRVPLHHTPQRRKRSAIWRSSSRRHTRGWHQAAEKASRCLCESVISMFAFPKVAEELGLKANAARSGLFPAVERSSMLFSR